MNIRRSYVSGRFYPDNKEDCIKLLEECLNYYQDEDYKADVIAGIVPHAGWVYSGPAAAKAFLSLDKDNVPDTFVFLGAVHRYGVKKFSVCSKEAWETPIGNLEIDKELARHIVSDEFFEDNSAAHDGEHSIEVNLPFAAYLFPKAKIVPIACPPLSSSYEAGIRLARILSEYPKKAVVFASTDLTHYGPSYGFAPVGTGKKAQDWVKNENDGKLIELALKLDGEALLSYAASTQSACGAGAFACALGFAKSNNALNAKLLKYTTSLDMQSAFRDGNDFVGYCSIVYSR